MGLFDWLPGHHAHESAPAAPAAPAQAPVTQAPVADGATAAGAANVAAQGLGADTGGPRLNPLWNHLMGGPGDEAGDGRPLSTNHIGSRLGGGPVPENGTISNLMHDTPYLGDYWEALSVTHDSRHIQNNFLNAASAVTNVGLTGPLMGLVDAPFRAFGHSLFLDQNNGK